MEKEGRDRKNHPGSSAGIAGRITMRRATNVRLVPPSPQEEFKAIADCVIE